MTLLNTKELSNCLSEEDILQHEKEIEEILTAIGELPNLNCLIIKKYKDLGNCDKKEQIIKTKLSKLEDVIEECDCKNGADIFMVDRNYVFVIYGQPYKMNGAEFLVITELKVILDN